MEKKGTFNYWWNGCKLSAVATLISTLSLVGCANTTQPSSNDSSTALSITGTLKTSTAFSVSSFLTLNQTSAINFSDLLVSCVTFTIPPAAGTGGAPDATGKFTITFGSGTIGKSFGCYISHLSDDTFVPIPMVFIDGAKKSIDGNAAKSERLAVAGKISIPEIHLNLDEGVAEVDTSTIVKTDDSGGSSQDVIPIASGTPFDFTGNWTIESPADNDITVPNGYFGLCSAEEAFDDYWSSLKSNDMSARKCHGPIGGMKLYIQRLKGQSWTPGTSCETELTKKANGETADLSVCNTDGTAGTDEKYAIQIWRSKEGDLTDLCERNEPKITCYAKWRLLQETIQKPDQVYHSCGRRLGYSNTDAKAFGHVDFSVDPNYSSSGSSTGVTDTKYYDGPFTFLNSATVNNQLVDPTCSLSDSPSPTEDECKPFKSAENTITDGWKMSQAQITHSESGSCIPVKIQVGTSKLKATRCYGDYYPNNLSGFTGDHIPAFYESFDGGCKDANGRPVIFENTNDYWCADPAASPSECTNQCTSIGSVNWIDNGTTVDAGYPAMICQPKSGSAVTGSFVPKNEDNQVIPGIVGPVQCKKGGWIFDNTNSSQPRAVETPNIQNFDSGQISKGLLCSDIPTQGTGTVKDRQLLAQLQCYARAYEEASGSLTGCVREISFNRGAENPWSFISQSNGPTRARGEIMFEVFNYVDNSSGTFSQTRTYEQEIRVKNEKGNKKSNFCRLNVNDTLTLTSISSNKMLAEMTTTTQLADKGNSICMGAVQKQKLPTGQSKMMFVLRK